METSTSQDNNVFKIIKGPLPHLDIHLIKSANAWWMDIDKVIRLLEAFRYDALVVEACSNAGITQRQYKYFAKLHPIIKDIREYYSNMIVIRARKTVYKKVGQDYFTAIRYLRRKRPEEFRESEPVKKPAGGSNIKYFYGDLNTPVSSEELDALLKRDSPISPESDQIKE